MALLNCKHASCTWSYTRVYIATHVRALFVAVRCVKDANNDGTYGSECKGIDHRVAHTSSAAPPANIFSLLLLRKLASWKDAHISLSPANCTMPSVMGREPVRLCWLRPALAGTALFRGDMSSSRRSLLAGLGCCLVASSVPATKASAVAN